MNKLIFPYRRVNLRWNANTNIQGSLEKSLIWFGPIRIGSQREDVNLGHKDIPGTGDFYLTYRVRPV